MCGQFYIMLHGKKKTIFPDMPYKIMVYDQNQFSYQKANWGFKINKRPIINARSETLLTKPTFIGLKHCLIMANGYYEWDEAKMKTDIHLNDHSYLYMAGLYRYQKDRWEYTIITTKANPSVDQIHDRMPLILTKDEAECWVRGEGTEQLLEVIPPAMQFNQEMSQSHLDL
ncbi:SOS response-associated peptidase [Beduini massiliensis]|uniref:SOS response-associated peptidase n=1 Tax=Beduini massiliensis TaxID=1585974 RepID=UPI000694618D|nr:SOS response-associated peptidase family protein [Beduini massiliensis]